MFKESRKSFTLIELLVVVAIIGLLAAVVIVNLNAAQKTSRDAKRKADLATVQNALEQYFQKNGSYPATPNLAETGYCWRLSRGAAETPTCPAYEALEWVPKTGLVPDFISVLPLDPRNTASFVYYYRSDGSNYKLMSRNMESDEGKNWAINDGGKNIASQDRNFCPPVSTGACPSVSCACDYELFSSGSGAPGW